MPARVPVTAVLVAHDGSRWLPEALTALRSQTAAPARVVAVDTGSTDDSAALLRRATGQVLELPRTTGYVAAVAAALAGVPDDTAWIWLLHDDCAPDRDALAALLREAAASPSTALLGPKAVEWDDPQVLAEMGCTTDVLGAYDVGVEPGELDQGQHDRTRDVLAVGTAGALVRRDVWDALGGLSLELPLFRDGLDLGWRVNAAGHRVAVVPAARVRHARAATRGMRPVDAAPGGAAATDRRAALQVLLAHAAGGRLAVLLPLLAVASVLRALGLLLGRAPRAAVDELTALLDVLARPARLLRLRRARARTRVVPPRALRPLMGSTTGRLRTRLRSLADRGGGRAVPALDDPAAPPAPWRSRLLSRPGLALTAGLALLALAAERSLIGRGALVGGRLLAAPEGAADLWRGYAAGGEASVAVLAPLATLLAGQADLAVDLLLLATVPLSAAVAYAVAGHVVRSPLLRVWAAASWALLPVATGAVAAGRLDAAVVHLALPGLLLLGDRLLRRDRPWSSAWAAGLALTAVAVFSPLLWLVLGLGLVALALLVRRLRAALAAALPLVLLVPWAPDLLEPVRLLHGPGRLAPALAAVDLPAWHLLLLQPGGPGTPALLVTVGLVAAAVGGLLRTRRAAVAAAGWGLALVGLAVALVLARLTVGGSPVWPGVPLDVAAAGMLLAALVGAEGLQASLTRMAFGRRQLMAVAVVVAAAVFPLLSGALWLVRGAEGPLQRADPQVLPAFAEAELELRDVRALLLSERSDGSVGYAVVGADGARLGQQPVRLDEVVADLLTPRGGDGDPVRAVAAEGIAFVSVAEAAGAAQVLDAQPGLSRLTTSGRPLWRVERPVAAAPTASGGRPLLPLQVLALVVAAVLAGPGARPRQGLLPAARR
jgi:GT2 family glycosyltransferase